MTADSENQVPNTTIKQPQDADSPAPDSARDHYDRAIAWLRQSEWDNARADLTSAVDGGLDVAATFIKKHKSAGEFEDAFNLELPPDIADILDPISEEEDAALVRAMEEARNSGFVSRECIMSILRGEDGP